MAGRLLISLCAVLFLSGCALIEGAPMLSHVLVKEWDESRLVQQGVSDEDLQHLRTGEIQLIRERYEALPNLTNVQQRLLCDIYLKQLDHQATECLAKLENLLFRDPLFNQLETLHLRAELTRGNLAPLNKTQLSSYIPSQPPAVAMMGDNLALDTERREQQLENVSDFLQQNAADLKILLSKKALLELQRGDYAQAAQISRMLDSFAGRYIHALARLQLGDGAEALRTANWLAEHYETEPVYLAANMYLAAGEYQKALGLAENRARRLALDFGLRNNATLFGGEALPGDFRFDLFDEFRFGLLNFYSYAPRANAYVEFIIAKSQFELGNLPAATQSYDLILATPEIENYRDIYWLSLFDRGRIAERLQQRDEAEQYYRLALETIESYRATVRSDVGRLGLVGDPQQLYGQLIELLLQQGRDEEAFVLIERSRNRETIDWAADLDQFAGGDDEDAAAMQRFMQAEKALLSGALAGNPAALQRARSAHAEAREQLRGSTARYKNLVTVDQPDFNVLHQRIGVDETIVTYYLHNQALYAFVLNREDQDLHIQRLSASWQEVANAIAELRQDIATPASSTYINPASQLHDWLIKPIQPKLNKKQITFSVNGDMLLLPYAVLFDGQNHLVQRYRLNVLPNLNVINQLPYRRVSNGDILIVGNPDRGPDFDLPHAQLEAELIADNWHLGQATKQLKHQATLKNFAQLAGKHQFIHIAAHAIFDRQQPLDSHILFAQPLQAAGSDGKLHSSQLLSDSRFQMRANLVVLSGCETAISSDQEQLSGLAMSFLYAGANSVLGSLWTVDDRATAFLMERFYNRLNKGFTTEGALQNAQLATLDQFPHPYYWAAFQYTGHEGGDQL